MLKEFIYLNCVNIFSLISMFNNNYMIGLIAFLKYFFNFIIQRKKTFELIFHKYIESRLHIFFKVFIYS